jgi:hypothetical protein
MIKSEGQTPNENLFFFTQQVYVIDLTINGFAVKCNDLAAEIGHEPWEWEFVESRQKWFQKVRSRSRARRRLNNAAIPPEAG